ncbi:flavin reductase (DIM6/NTAB) family NADH-FMN oxidoreductase RutF [Geomicrobium halophilum]|uniref:Flavin reductase (DIM6/NTAB) family NADH-FMN oxidoreductase RutF n=1 Tax=Geomicrobium halophilum TaxID=549000 RepID=A0A841Q0T1_9BACL|nr:flavin reductase family protein [Geomicrobium halophilum]MBB6451302.1 flavin reductase (DIM6/NTAB) family NADH-FMN oxidoreductase RutF [Geomicrobium halophilum]
MDDKMFRAAMGKFTTGVTVITTEVDGDVRGMTANAFMSVSMDPKLILISVAHKARLKEAIEQSGQFAVNVLSNEQKEMSMIFAGQKKDAPDIEFNYFEGLPVIEDSLVSIVCDVHNSYVEGDHTLFVGRVKNLELQDGDPLAFHEGCYKQLQEA